MFSSQDPELAFPEPRRAPLASVIGLLASALNVLAEVMLLPSLILAFFAAELTPSYPLIGLVPALAASMWTVARVPAHLLIIKPARRYCFGLRIKLHPLLAIRSEIAQLGTA